MIPIIIAEELPAGTRSAAGDLLKAMVDGANAKAARVAPCLAAADPGPSAGQLDEAALILIGAVTRWSQAGAGAVQQQTAGPYSMSVDTRQRTGFNLWPSEIADLQAICKNASDSKGAYSVDTVACGTYHSQFCSLYFGGVCSCGADIAGAPIYETG